MWRGPRIVLARPSEEGHQLCRSCRPGFYRRLNRSTWMERSLLTWLGFYPWECVTCRRKCFLRLQGGESTDRSPSTAKRAEA